MSHGVEDETTVNESYSVTVPAAVRREADVEAGDKLRWRVAEDGTLSIVLIAARLSRDQNHERGTAIVDAIDLGQLPTAHVYSDVLEEICNYLQARAGHESATTTLDALVESSGFVLTQTAKSDFDAGRSLFRRYDSLSVTDAIIVAAMQREEIDSLYSFDDGFDSVPDLTRLTTPENPFET